MLFYNNDYFYSETGCIHKAEFIKESILSIWYDVEEGDVYGEEIIKAVEEGEKKYINKTNKEFLYYDDYIINEISSRERLKPFTLEIMKDLQLSERNFYTLDLPF